MSWRESGERELFLLFYFLLFDFLTRTKKSNETFFFFEQIRSIHERCFPEERGRRRQTTRRGSSAPPSATNPRDCVWILLYEIDGTGNETSTSTSPLFFFVLLVSRLLAPLPQQGTRCFLLRRGAKKQQQMNRKKTSSWVWSRASPTPPPSSASASASSPGSAAAGSAPD